MSLSTEAEKVALEALEPDHVSLHTADPGTTGEHEVSGGSYSRQALEWNAPSAGAMTEKTGDIAFSIPAETTVKFVSWWKSGKFYGSDEVTEEHFKGVGTYTLESATFQLSS